MPELMDGAGHEVTAAPVRMSDRTVRLAWLAALVVCIPLGGLLFGHYPMVWTPVEPREQTSLEEIRETLTGLGFPEEVMNDLAKKDLEELAGAVRVTVQEEENSFNDGRTVTQTWEGYTQVHTEYDIKELKLTSIAVELPDSRWRVIHHFLWQADPPLQGSTECIELWTGYRQHNEGFYPEGKLSGRVLYDWNGTVYAGDYYSLKEENYVSASWFSGPSANSGLFALFSLPQKGERCRGYVTYGMVTRNEGCLLDAWINYTHQTRHLNYPLMSAKQYAISGAWGSGDFRSVQAALQFVPGEEPLVS